MRMRLTRNPGAFFTTTGVLPSLRASASAVSRAAGDVRAPTITSTSGMRSTGLKKWSPARRSGRASFAAMRSTSSDDVLVSSTACAGSSASTSARTDCLTSRFSTIASITTSSRLKPDQSVPPVIERHLAIAFGGLHAPPATRRWNRS